MYIKRCLKGLTFVEVWIVGNSVNENKMPAEIFYACLFIHATRTSIYYLSMHLQTVQTSTVCRKRIYFVLL
jgi:hypothetical protein